MKACFIITEPYRWWITEFEKRSLDISVLKVHAQVSWQDCLAVPSFMDTAAHSDIIHSMGSLFPLLFQRSHEVPVLTTVDVELMPEEAAFCLAAGQNCFFDFAPEIENMHGLNGFSRPRVSRSELVEHYLEIYRKIIQLNLREDHRPWGFYEVISEDGQDHKVKRITVWPGKRLSLQVHARRKEHWLIVSGRARITLDGDNREIAAGESVDIPIKTPHRIENIADVPLVFIEVQQGDYFGEDDIIRLDDDFGRT